MEIHTCSKADFDRIVTDHSEFWDSELSFPLHHPTLIFEFGDTAFVIRDGDRIAAYLFGFFAQTGPVAYVHLVAVRPDYRGRGLAGKLYAHFVALAKSRGCSQLKATAAPGNAKSIAFHTSLGMTMIGQPNGDGVTVVKDYLRPGVDRVVFQMDIA